MFTKETKIIDVLQQYPQAAAVFERLGMGCMGCMGITNETLENGAKMHQIPVEILVTEINKLTK